MEKINVEKNELMESGNQQTCTSLQNTLIDHSTIGYLFRVLQVERTHAQFDPLMGSVSGLSRCE